MPEPWPILRQDEAIPFGFCQCGCGNRTAIIYQTNAARVTHPENVQRGANARLTAEDVEEIRRLVGDV